MTKTMLAAGLAALTIATTAALADSTDPSGPRVAPRDPGGISVRPMPSGPSYPGPSVDTWLGTRFPPPAPPDEPGLTARPDAGPDMTADAILIAVGASARGDDFEDCMAQADGIDFIDALGACFCLTVGEDSPGCAADGY